MGKPFSTKMLILLPQKSRCSVTTSKQSVVLGRLLAADTLLSRLEGLQRSEWDTETLGSHGRSTRLQVLVPKKDQANSPSVVEIKHSEHNKQTVGESHVYNTNMSDLLSSGFLDPVLAFNSSTEWDLDNLSSKGKYMRSIICSDEERR